MDSCREHAWSSFELAVDSTMCASIRAYTHARPRVFRESGRVLLMARIVLLCLRDERITVRCPLSEPGTMSRRAPSLIRHRS